MGARFLPIILLSLHFLLKFLIFSWFASSFLSLCDQVFLKPLLILFLIRRSRQLPVHLPNLTFIRHTTELQPVTAFWVSNPQNGKGNKLSANGASVELLEINQAVLLPAIFVGASPVRIVVPAPRSVIVKRPRCVQRN